MYVYACVGETLFDGEFGEDNRKSMEMITTFGIVAVELVNNDMMVGRPRT